MHDLWVRSTAEVGVLGRGHASNKRVELSEGRAVLRGAALGIEHLWACSHAVIGIPIRPLYDGARTIHFAALVDVLMTGKLDDGIFVCRADAIQTVAHTALTRWPGRSTGATWHR